MKKILLLSLMLLALMNAQCQSSPNETSNFNLDFEKKSSEKSLPDDWFIWGTGYDIKTDSVETYEGKYAITITPPKGEKQENAFGCIAYMIPAKYKADTIELKAHIKMENVSEAIGLMLRIDGPNGGLAFDNMQQHKISGTADWKEYSVKLPYPKAAQTIYVGAILSGMGKIWADNFEVLLDGENIKQIQPIEPEPSKASLDKEFDVGSKINSIPLDVQSTENLYILGLTWGFLKYYHPTIAAGNHNWDYELFRYLPKILAVNNSQERNRIISDWIESLGTFEEHSYDLPNENNTRLIPDLDWIENSRLEPKLVAQLTKVKNAKRVESYYIAYGQAGNADFKNENPYTNMKYPDAGFRLLTLYRYWNMIQYYFPYKYLIEEDWKDILKEFIPKLVNASDETEYTLAALELIGQVHDTHANIWHNEALNKYWGTMYAPHQIKFVEGKAVVTNFFDKEKASKSELQIGDVITHIDGKPVDAIVKEREKYNPASNTPTQLRDIARKLLGTKTSDIEIEYLNNGKKKEEVVKAYNDINIYNNFAPDTCFSMINKDIAYIYPGKLKNAYLENIMKTAMKSKGLIIDFRCYPADFTVFTLGSYLMPESREFVRFTHPNITLPGYFTVGQPLQVGKDNADYYKGKIVILINETTQSSAEYTTMAFRAAPNVTIVGSTTAGADGNVSPIILPGNIHTTISGIGVYYPDDTETQRIGIAPNIDLHPTIKGIKEGKDELLERAIEIINKK